jgi:hypothetical protein
MLISATQCPHDIGNKSLQQLSAASMGAYGKRKIKQDCFGRSLLHKIELNLETLPI